MICKYLFSCVKVMDIEQVCWNVT